MQIDILSVPECPNLDLARSRVQEALAVTGAVASVREIVVRTQTAAELAGMRGSPTILIDGCDPCAGGAGPGSLSCRLYTFGGHISGAPETAQLVGALR